MKTQVITTILFFVIELGSFVVAAPTTKDVHIIPLQRNTHFQRNAAHALFKARSKYAFLLDQINAVGSVSKGQGSVEMTDHDDIE